MKSENCGHIYFLANPSLSGLIKIGFTERELSQRIQELRSTGVPTSFVLIAAFYVHSPKSVESAIHKCLFTYRVKSDREFFQIPASKALELSSKIIFPALVEDEITEPLGDVQSHELSHAHCILLELAFGEEPYSDIVKIGSS